MKSTHGGDIESYRIEHGKTPLDFSSNGNPIGMPKAAQKAIIASAKRASAYPDPYCRKLRNKIAKSQGIDPEHIICGNGVADIIYRLAIALRPATALTLAPTFIEYGASLSLVKTEIRHHHLLREEGFQLTDRILDDITPSLGVVYLCNPNNPTGLLIEPARMDAIIDRCNACGTMLVVDECFLGFVEGGMERSVRHRAADNQGILVLDAFTKLFGMAGLRLGYGISSNKELLQKVYESGQPWPVSSLAQAAGVAALKRDRLYLKETHKLVDTERAWLKRKLEKLDFEVLDGQADYLFFLAERDDLAEQLRSYGILIRDCRDYVGLEPGAYRIAVRTHDENEQLVRALKKIV